MGLISPVEKVFLTIANGESVSGSVNLNGMTNAPNGLRLFGIVMPAAWTAANLTFQVSYDNGASWVDMYDDGGSEIVAIASTSRLIVLRDPTTFSAVPMLKVRSGTAATPVNQGAARTLTLVLRAI